MSSKERARGINDADFGEVQLTIGDTVIQKKVSQIKKDYLPHTQRKNNYS
ncbi:MAG TPA: hypothetical protein VE643_09735 [Nitrososphaeraceae archaeon]|nr:hypothetical protein [Nitrososphaeraceae archaeon]